MAMLSFGLGFYGLTVYLAALQRLHGWSASAVSAPVTVYYVAGALLTAAISSLYARFGPRVVVAGGGLAMAAGLAALGRVGQPWQLYPAFLVMSVGWGALSGAAINIILAPWWERRRGLAISIAFNGATLGGVIVAPALIWLIDAVGFTTALTVAAIGLSVGAARHRRRGHAARARRISAWAPTASRFVPRRATHRGRARRSGEAMRCAPGASGACPRPSPWAWPRRSVSSRTSWRW